MFKPTFAELKKQFKENEKITPEIIDSIKSFNLEPELIATYKQLTKQEKEELVALSQHDPRLKSQLERIQALENDSRSEDLSALSEEEIEPEIREKLLEFFKDMSPEEFFRQLEADVKKAEQSSELSLEPDEESPGYVQK